jgi:hypothetical protein
MEKKKIGLLIVSMVFLYGLFYWLNTKDNTDTARFEEENLELKKYIENVYAINPYEFNIAMLNHYNDSIYPSITERLSNEGLHLVLYIPEKACQDCVIKEYEKLLSLPAHIQDKIIIMTSFLKTRDVKMWISSRKYKYPVYNNPLFKISSFGAKNELVLFLVNESGIPTNFLILKTIFPGISDNYYKYVIHEFEKEYGNAIYEDTLSIGEKAEVKVVNNHDFEELNLKEKVFTFFEFENVSSVPLFITDVRTNCGCTAPEWDRKQANTGEKLKVKVAFTAENTGFFSKRITVFSNAKDSPHNLTITGKVK